MSLKRIGRYEIIEEIGRGGMATVFRALDPRFQREVALKALPRHYLHDPTFRARFEREAQTIATLEHPAIVPVYDFGEENSQPFLVMRLMRGGSLVDRINVRSLPLRQAAEILTRLAPALDYAHNHAIIHRDLKPQNVLFDRWDKPYLADFGIVKLVEESITDLTASGGVVGTPAYMSPEQVSSVDELDGRSDIYALGVILFEMLAGKLPYNARTPMGLALKHITEPIPIILDSNQSLPAECQEIIDRAMAKDREERYQTAAALAAAVSDLAAEALEAPFVRPSAPIFVTPPPVTPDSPVELSDEAEETQLAADIRSAALAAAAIKSPVSSEPPADQDLISIEQLQEEGNEAAVLPSYNADTPTEIEPVSAALPLEDDFDEVGEENAARLPALLTSNWRYLALILLLLLIGVGGYYALSAAFVRPASTSTPTPLATQLPTTQVEEFVPPVADPATATPSRTPAASATLLLAPSGTATKTPRTTRTPQETSQPSPSATLTPFLVSTPVDTPTSAVPLLIVSFPAGELKNPFNFTWSGPPSTRYRVVLRHLNEDYSHTSDWLSGSSWTFDIPAEQFGAWEWHVESESGERSTNSEFFFNPHTGAGGKPDSGYPGPPGPEPTPDNPYPADR